VKGLNLSLLCRSWKHRACVGKANTSGNDVSVPPGFPPNLVDTLINEDVNFVI